MAASSFDSPESSVLNVSEEKTNGTRLARLLIDGGTHALRKYFDTIHPPGKKLEDELNNNKGRLEALRKKRVIFNSQWETLFPSSGDAPESRTFDITLLHLLLREICNLKAPSTGWHNIPADDDTSPEASIAKIKCFRNELCHSISTGVPIDDFEADWNNIASSLVELGLDQREVDHLKTDPIDHDTQRRLEEEIKRLNSEYKIELQEVKQDMHDLQDKVSSIQDSLSNRSTTALPSCLPDEQPPVFGRSTEIREVTAAVQSGTVSVVLITGGPGFGKTTVAKEVARALEEKKLDEEAVLFCSIRSKPTLNEVATEMVFACGNSSGKPPENPKQWLLNWSRQRLNKVVFILDNADDVLNSNERDAFSSLLSQMRILSRQNVKFVITTRTAFRDPDLQMSEVRLACLSPEDARQVLVSRVQSQEGHKLSRADELVELCGFVPLALCIAGSLLPDYTEDELIAQLESDLLEVLQDDLRPGDQKSVENAIKASLNVLNESEQKGLVLMTVFPGSFNADAAKAVLGACSELKVPPERILRSLRNRSLVEYVEQPSSQRYQIHLLVQACVDKIAQAKYPQILIMAKKLACSHFISCFSELTKLYWGKDTSQQACESFNKDRYNFEFFLKVLVRGMEVQYPDIVETTKAFLDNLPQKCMFLEMCMLPSVYSELLKSLLDSTAIHNQPVHKVELLCLLWHETRKVRGHQEENKDYIKEAIRLHSKNSKEFQTKAAALSEVLFLNSYARFLSQQKFPNGPKEMCDIALNVCKEKLGEDHPETAATLLFAGRQAKRRKYRDEAERMLTEALEIFQRSLGKHFMTAQGLKDLADFYLFSGKTEPDLDKPLGYYEEALRMMKAVGLDNHKECILTLKNFALCHEKKENHEEAMKLLQRADKIAQRELSEDRHKWKVMVKTEMALLDHKMGNVDAGQELMRQALKMWQKIKDPNDWLGSRHKIREFLDRYPEMFPEEEFPRSLCC